MKATLRSFGLFLVLLILVGVGPEIALADPPPPSFDIDFSGDSAIWNPFEGFEACESFAGATACLELFNVACGGKGTCVGDATFTFSGVLQGSFAGPFASKASCKQSDNPAKPVCKVSNLKAETEGSVTNGGTCTGKINVNVSGPVDLSGFFDGKGTGKLNLDCGAAGRLRGSERGLFQYTVNPPTPWSLTVQVSQDSKGKLEGTATDSLGFSYTAKKSKYSEKKDESKIALTGDKDTESKGAQVVLKKLVTIGDEVVGGSAKVNVQGNKSTAELGP
jgi:hypothetical protein